MEIRGADRLQRGPIRTSRAGRFRASETLAAELREMILLGELDGDSRLPPEPVFAEQLGVSRHHLREALRLLEQDGLVRVRPGRNGGILLTAPTVDVLTRTFATILARNQTSIADLMTALPPFRQPTKSSAFLRSLFRSRTRGTRLTTASMSRSHRRPTTRHFS